MTRPFLIASPHRILPAPPARALCLLAIVAVLAALPGCDAPSDSPSPGVETQAPNDLRISQARLRAVPPGVRISAAYLQIEAGNAADRLLSATLAEAGRVEIHRTIVDAEGVMRMRPIPAAEGLAIPAGQTTQLAPGGLHLMIFDLQREPAAGERVTLELNFATAGRVSVPFAVFDGDAAGNESGEPGEHKHHH